MVTHAPILSSPKNLLKITKPRQNIYINSVSFHRNSKGKKLHKYALSSFGALLFTLKSALLTRRNDLARHKKKKFIPLKIDTLLIYPRLNASEGAKKRME
jgi:hypothetical protein